MVDDSDRRRVMFDFDAYRDGLLSARRRISRDRRRMTLEDAKDIIRLEMARRDQPIAAASVDQFATMFHRGRWWLLRHPRKARREGWRFDPPWRRSDD